MSILIMVGLVFFLPLTSWSLLHEKTEKNNSYFGGFSSVLIAIILFMEDLTPKGKKIKH